MRHQFGPEFLGVVNAHDISHTGAGALWSLFMRRQRLVQRASAQVSYYTLRRDAEDLLPKVKMDILRTNANNEEVREVGQDRIRQVPGLKSKMETAYVHVSVVLVIS